MKLYSFYANRVSNRDRRESANQCSILFLLSLAILLTACKPGPLAIYDFDDGTTQHWTVSRVLDDKNNQYTDPLFTLSHFEAAQYPNSFPGGDPLNDKKGSLLLNGYQMGPWAQKFGFPNTSEYWYIFVSCGGLAGGGSKEWQGIKGIKASLGDSYGATPGHVSANIGVRAQVGGQSMLIMELDSSGNPLFHPINHQSTGKWTHLNATLNIPANAEVYLVYIWIRGDWKNYHTYEGALMIDQVEPIK
jgi:hypothetical protein